MRKTGPIDPEVAFGQSQLIEGGPGTGKTAMLKNIAAGAIEQGTRPDRLVIVAPSRQASRQFRAGLIERVGQKAAGVVIGTAEDVARVELGSIGLGVSLAKGGIVTKCTKIAARACESISWREAQTLITAVKSGQASLKEVSSEEMDLLSRYNSELRKRNFWDAPDVLQLAIDAYEDGRLPTVIFSAILVDDGQELQPIAHRWLVKHVEAGVPVIVAGSREQTIFRFAGAAGGKGLDEFAEAAGAERIALETSHRCSAKLLTASALITDTERWPAHGASDETDMSWQPVESQRDEVELIAQAAEGRDITVLARANSYLDRIEIALIGSGVGYSRRGGSTVLTHPAFRALIDILRVCDKPEPGALKNAMSWLKYDYRPLRALLKTEGVTDGAWGLLKRGVPDNLRELQPVLAFLQSLQRWIQKAEGDPEQVFREVTEWLSQRQGGAWMSRLVNLPETLGGGWTDVGEIASHLESLLLAFMDREHDEPVITLSTIHAARGQEFDHVWVAGIAEGHCPDSRFSLPEEMMLLYVAMTRARQSLTLSGVVGTNSDWIHEKIEQQVGESECLAIAWK